MPSFIYLNNKFHILDNTKIVKDKKLITLKRNGAIPLPTEDGSILAHFS